MLINYESNHESLLPKRERTHKPIQKIGPERLVKALSEKQTFIEAIYYPTSQKELTFKPLTNLMIRLLIDPINDLINRDSNPITISRFTGRLLPTLDDWQQGKAPDLTYKDFKIILAKEKDLDENSRRILLQQFLIRIISQHHQSVSLRDYDDPMNEYIKIASEYAVNPPKQDLETTPKLEKAKKLDESQLKQSEKISITLKKIRYLTSQMKRYGVDKICQHYEKIQEIQAAIFPKDIDIIINSIVNDYPEIAALLKKYPPENVNDADLAKLDELSKDIFSAIKDKIIKLKSQAEKQDKIKTTFTEEDLSKNLNEQFETAFEYLMSLIPKEDRRFWDKSPYYILKLAMALRKIMPVANAEVLSQIWWQLRLGSPRAQDIIDHVKKELPAFVKKQKLEKYAHHLFDNFLGSEASSFEFQNIVPLDEKTTPNIIIFQIVKNLIRNHIPKDQKEIRFTLLDRDKKLLKISIPYQQGLTDTEIEQRITIALKRNKKWVDIQLSDQERAELSYLGHNAVKRKQNKIYQSIYQSFGKDQKTNINYDGDYLIQIGSIYPDSRDPRSLFAVDSHKAAIQLKFKKAGEIIITTRYNHQYFDGQPAKSHTKSLISEVDKQEIKNSSPVEIIPRQQNSQIDYLKDSFEESELELPLTETRADYDDDYIYTTVSLDENVYLSSTDLRSLVIAKANEIQYYQQLVANKNTNNSYFIRNPNANNIQPVIVAPGVLNRNSRKIWVDNLKRSKDRSKDGIGDVALFASIAGTKEKPLSIAGSILNKNLINMLTHSQGMISPLSEYANFTTAFSDAYRPATIDLVNPVPSIGIIGMGIDKKGTSHYTVRLMPSQAQVKFREAVINLMPKNITESQKTLVLKEFTKVIKAWDRLLCGQGSYHQISLKEYEKIRDSIVNKLIKKGLINLKNLKEKKIQVYLNEALQEAAKEIFDPEKIAKARNDILSLFQN